MLNEKQIERVLLHCKKVDDGFDSECDAYTKNQGWIDALKFVLSDSPVSDECLDGEETILTYKREL